MARIYLHHSVTHNFFTGLLGIVVNIDLNLKKKQHNAKSFKRMAANSPFCWAHRVKCVAFGARLIPFRSTVEHNWQRAHLKICHEHIWQPQTGAVNMKPIGLHLRAQPKGRPYSFPHNMCAASQQPISIHNICLVPCSGSRLQGHQRKTFIFIVFMN